MTLRLCLFISIRAPPTQLTHTNTHAQMHTTSHATGLWDGLQCRIDMPAAVWKGEWGRWGCGVMEVSRDKRVQWETALPRPFMAIHIPLSGFCPVMRMLLALFNNPITDHKGSWGRGLRALRLLLKGSRLCVYGGGATFVNILNSRWMFGAFLLPLCVRISCFVLSGLRHRDWFDFVQMWIWLKTCENQDQSDNREKLSGSASLDWKDNGCVAVSLKCFLISFLTSFPFICMLPSFQLSKHCKK